MKRTTYKTKVMAIVHGQSEYCICTNIKSNLRIKHEIFARDKGKSSIQISSIMDILNNKVFKTRQAFLRKFADIERNNKELLNFKLFIIMDVDDCTEEMKKAFCSGNLFKNHWLYPYIVPIYNDPNLEKSMEAADIVINKKSNYITLFPTNHGGDLDLAKAKTLKDQLEKCKSTNLDAYISYCIEICEMNLNE